MDGIDYKAEARGRTCMVQIPGLGNHDPETTVPAHWNIPGLNVKADDLLVAWACYYCHRWLDTEWTRTVQRLERDIWHIQGIIRTQQVLISENKLVENWVPIIELILKVRI